jgi:DNA repair exonuclease SbcCD ATPase subunit
MNTVEDGSGLALVLADKLRNTSITQPDQALIQATADELIRLTNLVSELAHQRDALGKGIAEAAIKAGIASKDAYLTGPHLLMLCDDMAESILAYCQVVEENPHVHRLVKELREHDDERLYHEADVLMSEAADTISMLSAQIGAQDMNVTSLIYDLAEAGAADSEKYKVLVARAEELKKGINAAWDSKAEDIGALYRKIASEKLRADLGWARVQSKSRECIELRERMAKKAAAAHEEQDPLQALVDQAQELDMGYGPNACPECGKSFNDCCIKHQLTAIVDKAASIADAERVAHLELANAKNGRQSDIAFGRVVAAENIGEQIISQLRSVIYAKGEGA